MSSSNIFIQELREKLSLAEIVGKKVSWDKRKSSRRRGNFWACCPFHDEKTASFKVDDIKGFYYCFGCHETGDCITFVRKMENLDFFSAIKRLALEAGMQIPDSFESKQVSRNLERRSVLLNLHSLAVNFYRKHLEASPTKPASDFIENRIGTDGIVQDFQLGFAPESKNNLFKHLKYQGYSSEDIISSGLCARSESGEIYDRFRNRIIFPIVNVRNEIVGLGGRALNNSASAKYLNSPETEIFQKGKLLFNQNNCLKANHKEKKLIVVEGYMDVIALWKIGIKSCVAPLGTAVTPDQLQKIWHLSNHPIFAFDGDSSGERALIRLAFLVLPLISPEKTIKACRLPAGHDPDDLISSFGKESLLALLKKPNSLLEILWENEIKNSTYKTPENRALLETKIDQILTKITNKALRSHFSSAFYELKKNLFRMSRNSYSNFLTNKESPIYPKRDNWSQKNPKSPNIPTSGLKKSLLGSDANPDSMESRFQETAILISLINHPQLLAQYSIKLSEIDFLYKDLETIYKNILMLNREKKEIDRAQLLAKLNEIVGEDVYQKLTSTGHLKINPFLKDIASLQETQMALEDVLTRKVAIKNMRQELADAEDEIQENADEALTWRLGQANQFLHHARSGKTIPDHFEKKNLEQDIKQIKDLIKNQIWIKKKSKKKTNQ